MEINLLQRNPYKGLASFAKEDVAYYFGREDNIKEVINKVVANEEYNLFTLPGISGVGKSSFLKAGIIPKFEDEYNYTVIYTRPGDDPFYNLSFELNKYLTSTSVDAISEAEKLEKIFKLEEDSKKVIKNAVKTITQKHTTKVLIIIDQFEELFTNSKKEVTQLYLEKLYYVIEAQDLDVKIIFSLRVDFLEKLLDNPKYFELFEEKSRFFLGHLCQKNLKKAIVEPAKLQGIVFEKGVVERILGEVKDEKGILPLLELYLTKLWDKQKDGLITNNALSQMSGVTDSIGEYAEEVYNEFKTPKEKESIKRIMIQVIFPGEGKADTRQIAILDVFQKEDREVISELATKRLLVTGKNLKGKETVEIIHEALISKWKRLKEWVDEYRPFRVWQNKLRLQISDWKKNEDESYLLRGRQLQEAREYEENYNSFMAAKELTFIEKSKEIEEALEKKQKKRIFYIRVGLFMFIMSLIGFLLYTNYQKSKILEQNNKILKLYTGFLVEVYRPNNQIYTPELLSQIIKAFDDENSVKNKVIQVIGNYGFQDPSKIALFSTSSVDFNVFIKKLFAQDVKYITNNLSDLSEDAIWAWNKEQLEAFEVMLGSKHLVNLDLFDIQKEKIEYLKHLYRFVGHPTVDRFDTLFDFKYFMSNDKNTSIVRGFDALLGYDGSIASSLRYIENNLTKSIGHKKYSEEELKKIVDNRLVRVQLIGKVLYEHSQKNSNRYSKEELKKINNMYNRGIFDIKSSKQMDKDYPFYKELLPSYMKSKYEQEERKKELIQQQRWLEQILRIVPSNPWALYKLSMVAFEKKEQNIKPYLSINSNAPEKWIGALKFVLNNRDLSLSSDNQKELISHP